MFSISLHQRFGTDNNVHPHDVRQVKRILNRLGYYTPLNKTGMTDIPDRNVFAALKQFQKDHKLPVDGVMKPGGVTENALNEAAQKNSPGFYIWRTVKDGQVRSAHAERDGHIFSWEIEPKGGHPGQDYNCRCWAEPVRDGQQPLAKTGPICFEAKGWKEETLSLLKHKNHEDNIRYPYLDPYGLVTIGIGFNVDKEIDFINLPLKYRDENTGKLRLATNKEKSAGYLELKDIYQKDKQSNGTINYKHTYYKEKTPLILENDTAKIIAYQKIDQFEKELQRMVPDFKCYPSPARQALMDMMYNMGASRFNPQKWDSFFHAVRNRDWNNAAEHSHRTGIMKERNQNVYLLLKEASTIEKEIIY